jgi:type I restriction enzyme M protein
MAIKKTELYSSLWQSCDALRGGMDASQYKDYVLTLLFMKYVTDKARSDPDFLLDVPDGASFNDMLALKGKKDIGEGINTIIAALAEENELKGVIDVADFNDEDKLGRGKEMVDRLSALVSIFDGLDLGANRAAGDDLLGDAYEYLMRHFATESGKSKGQFYTPAEVSRILASIVGVTRETMQDQSVYDPTCGSGSLLLKVADQAAGGLTIYGQEMDNATSALARMNMILHGSATASIWQDNTLSSPRWTNPDGSLLTFDFAVANPPFSYKAWSTGLSTTDDPFNRFEYGVPPDKNGDYAFLLHILKSLKSTGKAAVILPHGVLFRGNAESTIRTNLLRQGYILGLIGLPANLFYGTGIPACIIVLDKESAGNRNPVFMADASNGFMKDGPKNRLREQDIHKIVDAFNSQTELPRYSRLVPFDEIERNEFNLNIPRYIDGSEPEDLHDLGAHMRGGIPVADIDALEHYWRVLPELRASLFKRREGEAYSDALIEPGDVKDTILNHPEFTAFAESAMQRFDGWWQQHEPALSSVAIGDDPRALIETLSEDLLHRFADAPLLDNYDIYQLLMDYWQDTLQDDIYLLVQDGWQAARDLRELKVEKGQKLRETPNLIYKRQKFIADLIPPELIIERFYSDQKQQIEQLERDAETAESELESLIEEHGSEDGCLADVLSDSGKLVKGKLTKAIKEADAADKAILKPARYLQDAAANGKKAVKAAQEELTALTLNHYAKLDDDEIKSLLLDDKWRQSLYSSVRSAVDRVTQQLAERVKLIEERYAEPLPEIEKSVEEMSGAVEEHLRAMGIDW